MSTSKWKSVWAVAAGFLAAALLSIGMDAVMHATGIFPPMGEPMSDGLFVWATGYRCIFQALGGYLTARMAPARPMRHVWILGCIGLFMGFLGLFAWKAMGAAGGPLWYPIALVVLALPTVGVGGKLGAKVQ